MSNHETFENYRKYTTYNYVLDMTKLIKFDVTIKKSGLIFNELVNNNDIIEHCDGVILKEDDNSYLVQLLVPKKLNWGRGCTFPTRYYILCKNGQMRFFDYKVQTLQQSFDNSVPYECSCYVITWTPVTMNLNDDTDNDLDNDTIDITDTTDITDITDDIVDIYNIVI
ncbi:MAG: hypothetical protein Homavirus1_21 [Homavirus sp.]|uniref:Uncharacterized protein n=1 Tax=Homavirus sp. TaxID=2487769 RepID=A0A3G5A6Y1_9VIRU|nr:MAG: hypothetical protein Homavirus1_21 [Homavirus sp.]